MKIPAAGGVAPVAVGSATCRGDLTDGIFTYRFRPDSDAIAALVPDDIAVLGGVAYRRVISVEKQADAVVLVTKRTKLTDAIDTGTIAWKQMIDFGKPQTLSKASFGLDAAHLRPLTSLRGSRTRERSTASTSPRRCARRMADSRST